MRRFAVSVEGLGFSLPQEQGPLLTGFFTTRFVEADGEKEAADAAVSLVREELARLLGQADAATASIKVDDVWEDPDQFEEHAPGRGFTWYS